MIALPEAEDLFLRGRTDLDVLMTADVVLGNFVADLRLVAWEVDQMVLRRLRALHRALEKAADGDAAAGDMRRVAATIRPLLEEAAVPFRVDLEGTRADVLAERWNELGPSVWRCVSRTPGLRRPHVEVLDVLALRRRFRGGTAVLLHDPAAPTRPTVEPPDFRVLRAAREADRPVHVLAAALGARTGTARTDATLVAGDDDLRALTMAALHAFAAERPSAALGPTLTSDEWMDLHAEAALGAYVGLGEAIRGVPSAPGGIGVIPGNGRTFVEPHVRFYAALQRAAEALLAIARDLDAMPARPHRSDSVPLVADLLAQIRRFERASRELEAGRMPSRGLQDALRRSYVDLGFGFLYDQPVDLGRGRSLARGSWLSVLVPIEFGGERTIVHSGVWTARLLDATGEPARPWGTLAPSLVR